MKKHILVIDDDPALVDIIGKWLHINGFKVTTAHTCDYALSLSPALWQDINCIITGINQPGINGLQFTELIHLKGGPPVIVMSGFRPELASQTALKAGAVAFLKKPFVLNELLELLHNTLSIKADPS
jgi:DNA-binding response OmpR family regulator